MRADAHRNEERLVAAAKITFAEHGADASLEEIARRAGVGIGTLYRHFPTRHALLEAALQDYMEALLAEARDLLGAPSPADALGTWLRSLLIEATAFHGLAAPLATVLQDEGSDLSAVCRSVLVAGGELLTRAQQCGCVRPDAELEDLVKLIAGIAWTTEKTQASQPERADRLLALVMDGLRTVPS
jgi:AcrR family transcriptional regulator